ncbi:hypothetical protein HPB51_010415 [Rhipicephalus microplus]|uniref:Uncharacterized protein n=1 Tax=Rhipicephalus microplus TaxID=6941 RepID=A0A9J6E8F0_RHIMP|nr:hypothetical protein HPB51_010415 [Rhipicephalus microplus]
MQTAHLRLLFLQAVVVVFGAGFESWPHGHNSDSKEMCSAASIDGAFNEFLWWTTHQQLLGAAALCREALFSSAGIGVKTCPAAVIDTCLRLHLDASRLPHVTDGGVDHHQGCSSYDEKLLRLLLQLGPSVSGADMRTAHLRLLVLQVDEFYRYKIGATVRKSIPEPPGTFVRILVCAVLSIDEFIALAAVKARLLLSGDVEENPGHISKELEQELGRALRCLPQISEAQDKLMKQLEKLETGQQELKDKLQTLECKIDRLAGDLPTASSSEEKAELSTQHSQLVDSMRNALFNQDEIENRSRRNNLLFFGLPDGGKETWDESEKKVIDLCAEMLRVTVSPSARACPPNWQEIREHNRSIASPLLCNSSCDANIAVDQQMLTAFNEAFQVRRFRSAD